MILICKNVDEEMNKDHLLIKCKEVIESLNSEIEEERISYKIIKEESKITLLYWFLYLDERLKLVDQELYKYKSEYQEASRRLAELEEYCQEEKAKVHTFFEK